MSQNIVVLSGSPRKGGNTDTLVEAFITGAVAAGKSVTLFRAAELKVGGCMGCDHCFRETGVCIQNDDMSKVLSAMRQADAVVFASPVYFFGVTAQLKLVIDRLYALLKEGVKPRRAALLMTCGAPTAEAARASIEMFRQIGQFQKWEEAGVLVAPGMHATCDINGHEILARAEELGLGI